MRGLNFIRSVKGKIIIASILACFALFMAWVTSKNALNAVLSSVENISAPNDKLRLVNALSHRVTRLDQVQKALLFKNPSRYYGFFVESQKISRMIDTLKQLYRDNHTQIASLNTLKKLLDDRDRLYINYLNVRSGLINNKSFTSQVGLLNEMVNRSAKQNDSLVTTTTKRTSTTTIYPSTDATFDTSDHRTFFGKLFGKKRGKNYNAQAKLPIQVIDTELKVKQDTISLAMRDSLLKGVDKTIRRIQKSQLLNSQLFLRREALMNKASARVVSQILVILKKVENEAVAQTLINNQRARKVVTNSIRRISMIMLLFFVFTGLLVYLILRDVSRINKYRRQTELAREEAEYHGLAKQRFLANMSHEIRTPLQSIIGYAGLVKRQPHPKKTDIDAIYRSSNHLLQIVNEVLDYNRIISGKFTFVNEVFNMGGLLDEVVSVMQLQADMKRIALDADYENIRDQYVNADPFRLKQVLYNLLGNAIKFTQTGSVGLKVSSREVEQRLRFLFEVSDTGIGLTEAEIGRIFSEFEQAGDSRQNKNGTGLGLAIAKQLVESQGGSIDVRSKKDQGSTFTVNVIFDKAAFTEKQTGNSLPDTSQPGKDTVWVVDDDSFILELCARLFQQNKIPFRCFSSPASVLETPWDEAVKLLLIDIRMPGMSGMELCRLLRKQVPQDTRICALTAQVMPEEHQSVLKEGFNGILTKPFKESELLALVKSRDISGPITAGAPHLNIKAIERMTMGDAGETARVLLRFSEESLNDIAALKARVNELNIDAIVLLLHRIAGRTAQAGGRELAESFRLTEMALEKERSLDETRIKHILWLANKLNHLAAVARSYAEEKVS
jgi:signal transduction histidine kinase/CheY-like chemotaxis protein